MKDSSKVPWHRIREFSLQLRPCNTRENFVRVVSTEVQLLVAFDTGAGVFSALDARYLQGIGHGDSAVASYNSYYRSRQPFLVEHSDRHSNSTLLMSSDVINWLQYDYLEYATDFLLPNGMHKSLSRILPGHSITVAIQRSRYSSDFTDSDVATLGVVNEYVNSLYASFDKRNTSVDPALSAQEIGKSLPFLSKREAEVCSLIVRRLSTAEIAACLFISPRTVEKHVESIFDKLYVRSREQLRWRLGASMT